MIRKAEMKVIKNKPAFPISKLPTGTYFPVVKAMMIYNHNGKNVLVHLADGTRVWLPMEIAQEMDAEDVAQVKASDNWEIAYLGIVKEGVVRFQKIDVKKKKDETVKRKKTTNANPTKKKATKFDRMALEEPEESDIEHLYPVVRMQRTEADSDDVSDE